MFDHPTDRTHSLLVWEKGALIYERYALGANASRPEAGWSFGKTLIAVAVGRAVQLGVWQLDERSKQALNMQGKAGFSTENRYFPRFTLADHGQVYGGANNVWHALSSAQKSAEVGYNNGDYLWLLSQLQAKIQPQPLADWLQKEVLQPLGLENFYYTVDAQGQPILTGYTHAPARDWLKLGQLLLHNGQWREQAFLPDGWVDFMATPAPNYPDQAYGAGVWLNGQQFYTAPKHVLVMAGAYDQTLIIDRPAQRLLLRMGHVGDESALAHLNAALVQ